MSLDSIEWLGRFLAETPGDHQKGGLPRQVKGACWSRVDPTPVPSPALRLWSEEVANDLGIERGGDDVLSGNRILKGMDPYAQRYGGHQFGNWAGQLGDGRAITLGEANADGRILEVQLKGSGLTPYSRFADGKAVLRSSIREFLCSEAMFHLGVPTTRALSLATTGEEVIRDVLYDGRPAPEQGAVVCRVAQSFLRFGSFQIHSANGDYQTLRDLVDFTVRRHFPGHSIDDDDGRLGWLKEVAETTATMVSHWMRVGFVHGVMNTDNMSIHGLTIDYGPYGWVEDYDLNWTPNTTDSNTKRYTFGNQAGIAEWNLARLLEAIGPLMDDPNRLYEVLNHFRSSLKGAMGVMWRQKLGLGSSEPDDDSLVSDLGSILRMAETDMTIFFRLLSSIPDPHQSHLEYAYYDPVDMPRGALDSWLARWWSRVDGSPDRGGMRLANPKYILRNWMSQLAIDAAEEGDYSVANELHGLMKGPYKEQPESEGRWFSKRPEWARNRVGCSMLSCSS